jgi:hypothetical protein
MDGVDVATGILSRPEIQAVMEAVLPEFATWMNAEKLSTLERHMTD